MKDLTSTRYRGFTLTEIVTALMIIGMLYVIFGGSVGINLDKVDSSVVESRLEEARGSIDMYFAEYSEIPSEAKDVTVMLGFKVEEVGSNDGVMKYRTVDYVDSWDNTYNIYVYGGDESNIAYIGVVSAGPDGSFSGNIEDVGDDIMLVYSPVE